MITVIKTISGNYNIFGTEDNKFVLEGNLSLKQLKELKKEVDREVKNAS